MQLPLPFSPSEGENHGRAIVGPSPPDARLSEPGIEFVRMRRARRYILRVKPDGSLRVTVPRGGSRREAQEFVDRQRRWIDRERHRVRSEHAPREWRHGTEILLNGDRVTITVVPAADGFLVTYGNRALRVQGAGDLRAVIEADLTELARSELPPRLVDLALLHGLVPGRVSIRDQHSRWGSCARSGGIALNFRLVQMPPDIRDYVLLHELMHLRQQNHSRRFWRLIQNACPGFREAERWLRLEGKSLF